MDAIKQAFAKIKEDIIFLSNELLNLRLDLNTVQNSYTQKLEILNNKIENIDKKLDDIDISIQRVIFNQNQAHNPTHKSPDSAQNLSLSNNPTHIPTLPSEVKGLLNQNLAFSTGNEGVPTDKSTDQPTHQHTNIPSINNSKERPLTLKKEDYANSFERASIALETLDSLRKEIRLKFKRLTNQEMAVFSTIYSLEEQQVSEITYKTIAQRLNLSESSIRDYIFKLVEKGIPILKIRQENNKTVFLQISPDLQKIASLSTISQLREL